MKNSNLLIIYLKNSISGHVKTRLAKIIGEDEALNIYKKLIAYTVSITRDLNCSKYLIYDKFVPENDDWDNNIYEKYKISGNNLGTVMYKSGKLGFEKGYKTVVMIGADCPQLNPAIIESGFKKLETHDIVIGQAQDGGYYLLGLKKLNKMLFTNKAWGSNIVFRQTLQDIKTLKASVSFLPTLTDIDTFEDLKRLNHKWYYENKHNHPDFSRVEGNKQTYKISEE